MSDKDILMQLLHGNHLEKKDLKRAKQLIHVFNIMIEERERYV